MIYSTIKTNNNIMTNAQSTQSSEYGSIQWQREQITIQCVSIPIHQPTEEEINRTEIPIIVEGVEMMKIAVEIFHGRVFSAKTCKQVGWEIKGKEGEMFLLMNTGFGC